jgi:hypothetical protein
LDLHRARHGFDHATELGQDAVAYELYDSTAMPFDCGRDQFGPVGLQRSERAGFICAHQLAVAADIGREDCSQPPSGTHLGHDNRPYSPRFRPEFMARTWECLSRQQKGTWKHDVNQNIAALLRYIESEPPFRILGRRLISSEPQPHRGELDHGEEVGGELVVKLLADFK